MSLRSFLLVFVFYLSYKTIRAAKINTPRVLLPWLENHNVNFTFEIIEGGCYTWSLSRDDIIDLEPLYEDSWGHCSRAARTSVSKSCTPPGTVIILAEEINSGEILRGDVDVDKISSLKVISTTWKLFLEEAPEAFEVVAYDDQANKFSTLDGISFTWKIENIDNNDEDLVRLVRWSDTDYEAPRGVTELEANGLHASTVLLYGQAMGNCRVIVCLQDICTDFELNVIASVVLTPATALIAPGDTLRYKVVRARAGRLTVQDIAETLYYIKVPDSDTAVLDDNISLVRGTKIGYTNVILMSGSTEVTSASLTVTEPHSIRVTLRPYNLLIRGDQFLVHCVVLNKEGHALTAGDGILIRLSVEGEADVVLLQSTENGTLTDAVATNVGDLTITAKLHSIAGRTLSSKVEGKVSAVAIDPLEVVPPELYVAWTDAVLDIPLQYTGGGQEPVVWSEKDKTSHSALSLAPTGVMTIRGMGQVGVQVQLKKYSHVKANGRVISAQPEMVVVSTSGQARVGRPHYLHVALTSTHPDTGELYNFHTCNCASFAVTLLEGPEQHNVTAAPWMKPIDGACCVIETTWSIRGVCTLRVSLGRLGDIARVTIRAAPTLLWPQNVAALTQATLPVIAEGEALYPMPADSRLADLVARDEGAPYRYPDAQLFTLSCRRKGDSRLELVSESEEERESVAFEAACAPYVSRIRLEPAETPGNCSGGARIWLRPGSDVSVKVTLFDAIGRELLDERGPKVSWDIEPHHPGIKFKATDRLLVETHPEFEPVPVPYKYYQLIVTTEQAIGWTGTIKASIPDAVTTIQAKVVAPLQCEPQSVEIAWESETIPSIATVTGGSGRYTVETPKGVAAIVEDGLLSATVPGTGSYDLLVTDLCTPGESQIVEVNIEEVLSVEISTGRAIGVDTCMPISVLVKGVSHRYLKTIKSPEWRTTGQVVVKNGNLCGLNEGTGRVRAQYAQVWSSEIEIIVFPPLVIIPSKARVPPGSRLQLRHVGGPPSRQASLHYAMPRNEYAEVSQSGLVHGLKIGTAKVRLVAKDITNVEMASTESEVEVVPITGIRVRAATQTILVGQPCPLWAEGNDFGADALAGLQPAVKLTWSVRDPDSHSARLYSTHADDLLEKSVVEGLSVRVVPLKPGVITVDVGVMTIGQVADVRTWDSTIEILAISDIRTSVEGLTAEVNTGDRLSLALGASVRLKSLPRSSWKTYDDSAFELTASGEVTALRPGHGIIVAQHKDDRNNIYRETAIHVEVAIPHYCTAEPADDPEETAVRLVMRNSIGRELLAPHTNISAVYPVPSVTHVKRPSSNALGSELLLTGLDAKGVFMTFKGTVSGVTLTDEVWVIGSDLNADRVVATGSWGVCLEGVGWRAPPGISLYPGSGVTLAILTRDVSAKHVLKLDRPPIAYTIHQLAVEKMKFLPGDWPATMVPLSIESSSLSNGPVLCSEDQRYALDDVTVELPFSCRTIAPHKAVPVLDILGGKLGCSITPASHTIDASEVKLCAEWGMARTCTKVLLLPPIHVSNTKLSLVKQPTVFTISGHPQALKLVKLMTSPGLKVEPRTKDGEITVIVKSEVSNEECGTAWVLVASKLTAQEIRVEIERECSSTCASLLGALFSFIRPYLEMIVAFIVVGMAYQYYQKKQLAKLSKPKEPKETVLPNSPPPVNRSRTWSRSPYATNGPLGPVYGDTSVLPDHSFSPNHSVSPNHGVSLTHSFSPNLILR